MKNNELNEKSPKSIEQKPKQTKSNNKLLSEKEEKESNPLPTSENEKNEKPKSFLRKKEKKLTIDKIIKKKSQENVKDNNPNFFQQNKNVSNNNINNEAENLSQIKASQFQKKKTGIGGGHIPFTNRNLEKKLSLLKEMIRKSVEKRPQSADPSLKQKENISKIVENYQESLKIKTMPPLKANHSNKNFQNNNDANDTNAIFFSNDLEELPQKDEKNIIIYNNENLNEDYPEKPQKKSNFIRPPQKFEAPILKEITQKLERELAILPQKNQITFQNENSNIFNEQKLEHVQEIKMNPWKEALILLDCQDVDQAYESLLDNEDDIYLLRLMIKTGPCFKEIGEKTSVKLINRVLDLFNSNFIDKTCIDFFLEAKEERLFNSLSLEDQSYLSNFF